MSFTFSPRKNKTIMFRFAAVAVAALASPVAALYGANSAVQSFDAGSFNKVVKQSKDPWYHHYTMLVFACSFMIMSYIC